MRPAPLALVAACLLNAFAALYVWMATPLAAFAHARGSAGDAASERLDFFGSWAGLALLFAGIAVGYRFLLPRLPVGSINMPNKELWLAPEHREATLVELADLMFWLMALASLFDLALHLSLYAANVRQTMQMGSTIFYDSMVLDVGILAVIVRYLVRWSNPPER